VVAAFGAAVADVDAEGGDAPVVLTLPQAVATTITATIARIVVRILPRLTNAVLVARVLSRCNRTVLAQLTDLAADWLSKRRAASQNGWAERPFAR
jgi:C4-dicarboxylate transporter